MGYLEFAKKVTVIVVVGFGIFCLGCYFFGGPDADLKSCFLNVVRDGARLTTRHNRIMERKIAQRQQKNEPLRIKFEDHAIRIEGGDTYLQEARQLKADVKERVEQTLTTAKQELQSDTPGKISRYINNHFDTNSIRLVLNSDTMARLLTKIHQTAPTAETKKLLKNYAQKMQENISDTLVARIESTLAADSPDLVK